MPAGYGFSLDDILSHMYFVGATGSGKTSTLVRLIYYLSLEDRQKKLPCSIIFIDPHGDASVLLARLMRDWQKLILLDPQYVSFGMNPMELLPAPSSEAEKAMQIQNQVSELVVVLEDVLKTDISMAPRLTWIFRGGLYYLYSFTDSPTFLDLYYLVTDMLTMDKAEVREMLLRGGVQEELTTKTIEAIAGLEKSAFTAVLNRISNFVIPPSSLTARTFCTRRTTLPFDRMLQPGNVTIFRLSQFELPNDFRDLLTNALVLKIYFLTQERARRLETEGKDSSARTPVFLVIDEFQNIEKLTVLEKILSEARKFGLFLILAHQGLSQLHRKELQDSILDNSGTMGIFRLGPDDASTMAKVLGNDRGWRDDLVKLPNWAMVVRRNPAGLKGLARVHVMKFSPLPEPAHQQSEVIEFMKTEMNRLYGGATEDRVPTYRSSLEELRKEKGSPVLNPGRWALLTYLYLHGGPQELSERTIREAFRNRYGWDGTVLANAAQYCQERGYITERSVIGKVYRGRDTDTGMSIYDEPQNQDERDRARVTYYSLTDYARHEFFDKEIHSLRAGGSIHLKAIRTLLHEYWEEGCWTSIDCGEFHGQRPDIAVFSPLVTTEMKKDRVIEKRDSQSFDYSTATAVEVEEYPVKSQAQLRKNYEKNIESRMYRKVLFVVTLPEHVEQVKKILVDKDPNTYEVRYLNLLNVEETQPEAGPTNEPSAGSKNEVRPLDAEGLRDESTTQGMADQGKMAVQESLSNSSEPTSLKISLEAPTDSRSKVERHEESPLQEDMDREQKSVSKEVKKLALLSIISRRGYNRADIAKRLGLTERQISRYVRELLADEYLARDGNSVVISDKGKNLTKVLTGPSNDQYALLSRSG